MTRSARMRLVGYLRVSTEEQAREGVSLDAQQDRLRAYAKAHDAELVALDRDEGVSGKVRPESRPGLSKSLHRVRSGDADPQEQRVLARILDLERGGLRDQRIAGVLNSTGQLNPRTGKPWTRSTITSIRRTAARRALT